MRMLTCDEAEILRNFKTNQWRECFKSEALMVDMLANSGLLIRNHPVAYLSTSASEGVPLEVVQKFERIDRAMTVGYRLSGRAVKLLKLTGTPMTFLEYQEPLSKQQLEDYLSAISRED